MTPDFLFLGRRLNAKSTIVLVGKSPFLDGGSFDNGSCGLGGAVFISESAVYEKNESVIVRYRLCDEDRSCRVLKSFEEEE